MHRLHRKALGKLSGAALVVDGLLTRIFDSMAGNASPPKARNTLTHQAYPWIFSAGVIATAVAALGGAIGIATALRTSGSHAVILATNTFVPGAFDVAVGRRDIATIDQPIVIPPGAR
ncbi:MAG: hypothetical protein IT355_13425 [Gemmatimonadaceae bacterium]|nr:hypothetical protein [Gemmatimonadaceae bacterium]